jgi:hypothetical protein
VDLLQGSVAVVRYEWVREIGMIPQHLLKDRSVMLGFGEHIKEISANEREIDQVPIKQIRDVMRGFQELLWGGRTLERIGTVRLSHNVSYPH